MDSLRKPARDRLSRQILRGRSFKVNYTVIHSVQTVQAVRVSCMMNPGQWMLGRDRTKGD